MRCGRPKISSTLQVPTSGGVAGTSCNRSASCPTAHPASSRHFLQALCTCKFPKQVLQVLADWGTRFSWVLLLPRSPARTQDSGEPLRRPARHTPGERGGREREREETEDKKEKKKKKKKNAKHPWSGSPMDPTLFVALLVGSGEKKVKRSNFGTGTFGGVAPVQYS